MIVLFDSRKILLSSPVKYWLHYKDDDFHQEDVFEEFRFVFLAIGTMNLVIGFRFLTEDDLFAIDADDDVSPQ